MKKDTLAIVFLVALEFGLIFTPNPLKPKSAVPTAHATAPHWSYEGTTGPEHWGDISAEYKTCNTGTSQTPINIDATTSVPASTKDFTFGYKLSPLHVVNNGHTIQVNYAPGSFVTFNGNTYQLVQFHFHVPSEHTINGKSWPMNVHMVHKNESGKLLVVEVLFNAGNKNEELAKIFAVMPKAEGELKDDKVSVDASKLLPAKISYYHYDGSLTTPPCTEGVAWFVMKQAIDVAETEINSFKTLYPMNARPVQPTNQRMIQSF